VNPHQRFKIAGKAVAAWRAALPLKQAPAMPRGVAEALAALLWASGDSAAALVVLVCFLGLLRVGEALSLTCADLILIDGKAILILKVTKRGRQQKCVIEDKVAVRLLRLFAARRALRDGSLFDLTYGQFSRRLGRACAVLGLGALAFTTHSLRRGGASTMLLEGASVETICLVGRWASTSSARLYILRGEVFLQSVRKDFANALQLSDKIARCLPRVAEIKF
jgi:integrase